MLAKATVTVDLEKIRQNTRYVVECLGDVDVVAVTKVTCGDPRVARAMLEGGAIALGESRLENVVRLRDSGIDDPIWLLRSPTPGMADDVVRLTEVSLVSEIEVMFALNQAAASAGTRHSIIVMVDLGDRREGMMPKDVPVFLDAGYACERIDIVGVGVSLTCYGGVMPSEVILGELSDLAEFAEQRTGSPVFVSGGMSSSIGIVASGQMSDEVDSLRIGETILLGVSTLTREPILGLHTDAFMLSAPVIECKSKPSLPRGDIAQDAFGDIPEFEDRGVRRRAICAIGRQDVPAEGLQPVDERVQVLGASSDHLILDVEDLPQAPVVGEVIQFIPDYAATLRLFTSPYVGKEYVKTV